ncbi:MAG: SEC-C domain-containing protein, partial [Myxococcales bacterium]|nr:SEC-C domain-containing protein [Myxococcales bacterium]
MGASLTSELPGRGRPTQLDVLLRRLAGAPRGTYVARAKVGRNQPCPCGSGHKHKG